MSPTCDKQASSKLEDQNSEALSGTKTPIFPSHGQVFLMHGYLLVIHSFDKQAFTHRQDLKR